MTEATTPRNLTFRQTYEFKLSDIGIVFQQMMVELGSPKKDRRKLALKTIHATLRLARLIPPASHVLSAGTGVDISGNVILFISLQITTPEILNDETQPASK